MFDVERAQILPRRRRVADGTARWGFAVRIRSPIDVERDPEGVQAGQFAAGDGTAVVAVGVERAHVVAVHAHHALEGPPGIRARGHDADAIAAEGYDVHILGVARPLLPRLA